MLKLLELDGDSLHGPNSTQSVYFYFQLFDTLQILVFDEVNERLGQDRHDAI